MEVRSLCNIWSKSTCLCTLPFTYPLCAGWHIRPWCTLSEHKWAFKAKAGYTLEWLQVNQIGMWEEVWEARTEIRQTQREHANPGSTWRTCECCECFVVGRILGLNSILHFEVPVFFNWKSELKKKYFCTFLGSKRVAGVSVPVMSLSLVLIFFSLKVFAQRCAVCITTLMFHNTDF